MDAALFVCFYWFYVVACGFTVVGLVILLCFVCFVWDDFVNWYGAALLFVCFFALCFDLVGGFLLVVLLLCRLVNSVVVLRCFSLEFGLRFIALWLSMLYWWLWLLGLLLLAVFYC